MLIYTKSLIKFLLFFFIFVLVFLVILIVYQLLNLDFFILIYKEEKTAQVLSREQRGIQETVTPCRI